MSTALWAQETQSVNYIDADGQQQTVTATVVTNGTSTLNAGWYVVFGNVSRATILCVGDVHLILADGAKLTAQGIANMAGINVSVGINSFTIYGQVNQNGQLEAKGGDYVVGIGGGFNGPVLGNIKVSADCHVFADDNCPPTTEIQHDSDTDLTSSLESRYALIEIDPDILLTLRNEAISAIDEVIAGVSNADILGIAQTAKNQIMNANGRIIITRIKNAALAVLETAVRWYNSGKAEAFGTFGTEQPGHAVKVTKGDNEVILYSPDKVEFIIKK